MARFGVKYFVLFNIIGHVFCVPLNGNLKKRASGNDVDSDEMNDMISSMNGNSATKFEFDIPMNPAGTLPPVMSNFEDKMKELQSSTSSSDDDDFDDDDFDIEPMQSAPTTGGGSNVFSLLNLASAIFPGSSSGGNNGAQGNASPTTSSPLWDFKLDILKAIIKLGASLFASVFSSSSNSNFG